MHNKMAIFQVELGSGGSKSVKGNFFGIAGVVFFMDQMPFPTINQCH